MTDGGFRELCDELVPSFRSVPEPVAKTWLADADASIYGGIHAWMDRAAREQFTRSNLFNAVATHANFAGITSVSSP